MEQTINTTKRLLIGLSEIQPTINACGLDDESAKIREMKTDLVDLLDGLNDDSVVIQPRFQEILQSCLVDMLAVHHDLQHALDNIDYQNDEALTLLSFSGECFAARCNGYLEKKMRLGIVNKGHHHINGGNSVRS